MRIVIIRITNILNRNYRNLVRVNLQGCLGTSRYIQILVTDTEAKQDKFYLHKTKREMKNFIDIVPYLLISGLTSV